MSVSQTRSGAGAVKSRWTWSSWTAGPGLAAAPSALAHRARPQLLLRAQPPDPPLPGDVPGAFELVGQEPVAELGVVAVRVDQRVGQVGVLEFALADRVGQPGVVRLS